MSRLLDLPAELSQLVLVQVGPEFSHMLYAHSVCRVFAEHFNYELLANTTASKYNEYFYLATTSLDLSPVYSPLTAFLKLHAGTFLFHDTLRPRGVNMTYPNIINHVANTLLQLTDVSEGDVDAVRRDYVCDLSQAFAALNEDTVRILLGGPNGMYMNRPDSMTPVKQTPSNYMAAAAAVGNIDVMRHFFARGGSAIHVDRGPSLDRFKGFDSPIKAAASTRNTEVVKALLKIAEKELIALRKGYHPRAGNERLLAFPEVLLSSDLSSFRALDEAMTLAMMAGDAQSALAILTFLREQFPDHLEKYGKPRSVLVRAMAIGCLDLFIYLSEKEAPSPADLMEGTRRALKYGRSVIIHYLLTKDIISLNAHLHPHRKQPRLSGTPLSLAVKCNHLRLVQQLINAGAQVSPTHLTDALTRLVHKPTFPMLQKLIDNGATADTNVLEFFEKKYRGHSMQYDYNTKSFIWKTNPGMTTVLMAVEFKKSLSRQTVLREARNTKFILQLIVDGKLHVPDEPMPFRQLAQDVLGWLEARDAKA
ncbi:hypothetical protein BDW02DRAFT_599716 [Decorospora gaudefroyi]|uniref:Uncharacterized protein n=1 Tax=Decorospora gaudefroyi TaxID=184978 RepID=A0A6A5K4R0_9PLEO|nr:hypothetical protein BDW02DRAFT_599716 [Decorospora gaudefroyi]